MSKILPVLFASLVLLAGVWPAAAQDKSAAYGEGEVNGIRFSDYADFYKKWKLVTVTYRTDNNELRFAYANDLAFKTLKKGSTDYPDGAVFGKIPMEVGGDPAFTNSRVPLGAKRYQFMVRDKKKYAETGGWGYAIFDASGKVYMPPDSGKLNPGTSFNSKDYSAECMACHELVKNRNYIFSRLPVFEPGEIRDWVQAHQTIDKADLQYIDYARSALPEKVQKLIPEQYQSVRFLDGELRAKMFVGIAYEIRPALIEESIRSGKPVILLSPAADKVSLVEKADPEKEPTALPCKDKQQLYASYWTIGINPDNWVSKDLFCLGSEK